MASTKDGGGSIEWRLEERVLPLPNGASELLRSAIESSSVTDRAAELSRVPRSTDHWLEFVAATDAEGRKNVLAAVEQLPVSVEPDEIAGVKVFHVVPDDVEATHEGHLFLHVHGGAYVLGGGLAGTAEAIAVVLGTGIRAVSIDYRMPPRHPYPAAVNDVNRVYEHLVGERSSRSVAMGGSSAGAGITLTAIQELLRRGVETPGAIFVGTPAADMTGIGDTIHTNRGVDRHIPKFDGVIEAATKLYAHDTDVADPAISPINGTFAGFPPTLLVSGTRDLFLSNTVRTHTQLRQAGTEADLLVYEGMSHGDYLHVPTAPESLHFYEELDRFLVKHLDAPPRRSEKTHMVEVDSLRWT